MSKHTDSSPLADYLDEFVEELLECGAVLSQIIGHMVRFQASGRSVPDAAPIPEVAHSLLRSILGDLRKNHSRRDVTIATRVVAEATATIGEEVLFVDPEWIDEMREHEKP